jgi:hypothetical protein
VRRTGWDENLIQIYQLCNASCTVLSGLGRAIRAASAATDRAPSLARRAEQHANPFNDIAFDLVMK